MKRGRAETILREVVAAVGRWREFAEQASVQPKQIDVIPGTHRLDIAEAKS